MILALLATMSLAQAQQAEPTIRLPEIHIPGEVQTPDLLITLVREQPTLEEAPAPPAPPVSRIAASVEQAPF